MTAAGAAQAVALIVAVVAASEPVDSHVSRGGGVGQTPQRSAMNEPPEESP